MHSPSDADGAGGAAGFLSPPSPAIDGTALSGPQLLPHRLRVAKLLSSARYYGDGGEGRSEGVCMSQPQQRWYVCVCVCVRNLKKGQEDFVGSN